MSPLENKLRPRGKQGDPRLQPGYVRPPKQLGDKVEQIAKPIARAIDKIAGTTIVGCNGCKKMRDRLNAGMTLTEATKIRLIEFAARKLKGHHGTILKRVDERLKSTGKTSVDPVRVGSGDQTQSSSSTTSTPAPPAV